MKKESRKVKLVFMDCSVQLEGTEGDINLEALNLLAILIKDRLIYDETLNNLEPGEQEGPGQPKSKKLQFDSMFN